MGCSSEQCKPPTKTIKRGMKFGACINLEITPSSDPPVEKLKDRRLTSGLGERKQKKWPVRCKKLDCKGLNPEEELSLPLQLLSHFIKSSRKFYIDINSIGWKWCLNWKMKNKCLINCPNILSVVCPLNSS